MDRIAQRLLKGDYLSNDAQQIPHSLSRAIWISYDGSVKVVALRLK